MLARRSAYECKRLQRVRRARAKVNGRKSELVVSERSVGDMRAGRGARHDVVAHGANAPQNAGRGAAPGGRPTASHARQTPGTTSADTCTSMSLYSTYMYTSITLYLSMC